MIHTADAAVGDDTAQHGGAGLHTSVVDGRLRCVLNRPAQLNALTPDLLLALGEAVQAAAIDPDIRSVTVEGAGDRSFSAGFDIKLLAAGGGASDGGQALDAAIQALAQCPKPTAALIRGFCMGAGFELALSCDFRVAALGSRFSVPATRIGTVYRPEGIDRICRELGPTVTKALFVIGREFDSEQAIRLGIVQEVVDADALQSTATLWTHVPDQGLAASRAHKHILEAITATPDRSPEFWAPLHRLRSESLASKERRSAIDDFSKRSGDGKG